VNELAQQVGARLKAAGATLVTAESCTGGWVAQEVTSVAGSSAWFDRGFVTYTDASKQELLGVQAATLAQHGAVSEQTAREMAQGALARSPAAVSLSVTGIAGPGGAVPGKPVGTVCFAWARRGGAVTSETRRFDGDREAVRRESVVHALQGILRALDSAK
jgi:nicotinamide-nucleotide amidase